MLTAEEAAEKLRVHRMTISRWVTRGLIRPEKVGKHGQHFYTEKELMRFLREEGEDRWWQS